MSWPRLLREIAASDAALATDTGYRLYLRRRHGVTGPLGTPGAGWSNQALRTRREWEQAIDQVRALGLHPHAVGPKNWDSLAMLAGLVGRVDPRTPILDAGADLGSVILPWLFLYGFRDLVGVNLEFERPLRRGSIRYEFADITAMRFPDASFGAILCQSVLEHGVDVEAFLAEAGRLLRPGGRVLISVDYLADPVDTRGCRPFGMDYRVFAPDDVRALLASAARQGLTPSTPVDLTCEERAVTWERYGLSYTFLMMTLEKAPDGSEVGST